jgi:transposase
MLQSVPLPGPQLVERFFNKIKHCRRVATLYDKLAANYLAFVQLASIRSMVAR